MTSFRALAFPAAKRNPDITKPNPVIRNLESLFPASSQGCEASNKRSKDTDITGKGLNIRSKDPVSYSRVSFPFRKSKGVKEISNLLGINGMEIAGFNLVGANPNR